MSNLSLCCKLILRLACINRGDIGEKYIVGNYIKWGDKQNNAVSLSITRSIQFRPVFAGPAPRQKNT